MDEASCRARDLIEAAYHMTLATADATGKPWSSPVFFAYDEDFNLYWVSSADTIHSANIRIRPQVAITILGQPPDYVNNGVYFDAVAMELDNVADVIRAIQIRRKRPEEERFMIKSPSDVLGRAVWRMYKAVPVTIYTDKEETVEGQCITTRVKVSLLRMV